MKKEHLKTALIIGVTTSFVIAGAYLLMPDKYKDVVKKKAIGLKDKAVELKDKAASVFKKKEKPAEKTETENESPAGQENKMIGNGN